MSPILARRKVEGEAVLTPKTYYVFHCYKIGVWDLTSAQILRNIRPRMGYCNGISADLTFPLGPTSINRGSFPTVAFSAEA